MNGTAFGNVLGEIPLCLTLGATTPAVFWRQLLYIKVVVPQGPLLGNIIPAEADEKRHGAIGTESHVDHPFFHRGDRCLKGCACCGHARSLWAIETEWVLIDYWAILAVHFMPHSLWRDENRLHGCGRRRMHVDATHLGRNLKKCLKGSPQHCILGERNYSLGMAF